MAWFFPAFWPWYGFSVLVVSCHWIVTALESRAAPRSLLVPDDLWTVNLCNFTSFFDVFHSLWEEVSMRQQKQPCEPGKHVLVHELMKYVAKKRDLGISLQLLPCTTLTLPTQHVRQVLVRKIVAFKIVAFLLLP